MSKNRYLILFLSILLLAALACGPLGGNNGGNEGTNDTENTPAATEAPAGDETADADPTATAEPEPTATAEPEPTATAEPEPTATTEPEPEPAGLVEQTNELSGLTFGVPEGWTAENLFTVDIITSSETNMAALESDDFAFDLIDGAFGFILTGTPEEIDAPVDPGTPPLDVLNAFIDSPDTVGDIMPTNEVVAGPDTLVINGQDAAQAILSGQDTAGTPGYLLVTVVGSQPDYARYATLVMIFSESGYETMLADAEAVAQSMVIGEPSDGTTPGDDGDGGPGSGITEIPDGYEIYVPLAGNYSFFYPGDWTVDDSEEDITYIVSDPALIDADDFDGGAAILLLANEDVSSLFDIFTAAEVLDLFTGEDSDIFDSVEATGELVEYETFGQSVTSGTYTGDIEGNPVEAIMAIIQNGPDAAIVIAITDDADTYFDTMETVINSILITTDDDGDGDDGTTSSGEAQPIGVNQVLAGSWDGSGGEVDYVFSGVAGAPVLAVLVPDEATDATLEILSDGSSVEYIDDGFSGEAEAYYFVPDSDGDYTIRAGNFFDDSGSYTIYLFDLQPGSATINDLEEDTLDVDGSSVWTVDGVAGKAIIIYVRPISSNAEDMDLTLALADSGGNVVADTDATFLGEGEVLVYVPDADETFELTVEDFFGEAGTYEIFLLETLTS